MGEWGWGRRGLSGGTKQSHAMTSSLQVTTSSLQVTITKYERERLVECIVSTVSPSNVQKGFAQCAIKGAPETVHNKFTNLTDVHIWEFLKLTYYMSVSDTHH